MSNAMNKPKVAFVVGHSHWGKSETLAALTDGDRHQSTVMIAGERFFVRRTSNDDIPESYLKFISKVDPSLRPAIIAALCPDFDDARKDTKWVLETLKARGYRMYFWILGSEYKTGKTMPATDVARLQDFGHISVFSGVAEASVRALAFRKYIAEIGAA